jgi:hypothetical protein
VNELKTVQFVSQRTTYDTLWFLPRYALCPVSLWMVLTGLAFLVCPYLQQNLICQTGSVLPRHVLPFICWIAGKLSVGQDCTTLIFLGIHFLKCIHCYSNYFCASCTIYSVWASTHKLCLPTFCLCIYFLSWLFNNAVSIKNI